MGDKARRRTLSLTWLLGLLLLAAAAGYLPSLVSGSGGAAGVVAGWPATLGQAFGLRLETLPDGVAAGGGTRDAEGTVAGLTDGRSTPSRILGAVVEAASEPAPADGSATWNVLHGPGSLGRTEAPGQHATPTNGAAAEDGRSITAQAGDPGRNLPQTGTAPGATGIGLAQTPADLLPLNSNQALLGPLAGATIRAYRLGDLGTPVEGPILADRSRDLARAGTFQLDLAGIPKGEWILVTATGGQDIDADDDGVLDASPTLNQGTIHALAKAADWRFGGLKVSALTDIFWRYTQNLADKVRPDELSIRLGDLLSQFIQTDLTGDGAVTLRDLQVFSPANPAHRAALNFDYQRLFTLDAEGHSIVAALHAGDEATLERLLDREFGHTLSRFPAPDSRYHYSRIALGATGEGRAAAAGDVLLVDSALLAEEQVRVAYFPRDAAQSLVLTAEPAADSHVLSWTGCDLVSNDRTQCTVGLGGSRDVWVSFGWLDRTPPGINRQAPGSAAAAANATRQFPVHDLSAATNTLYPDLVDVVVSPRDPLMIPLLASIKPDDYIVGSTGDGFLRRVTAVHRVDDAHYRLETVEANLDEVVGVGSASFSRTLTNGDLRGYQAPTARSPARVSSDAFQGLPGIRLVPSENPMDTVFRLEFGAQGSAAAAASGVAGTAGRELSMGVTLYEEGPSKVTATGTVEMTFDVQFDPSYCGFLCLQHLVFVAKPVVTTSLSLSITGTLAEVKREQRIGSISFSRLKFIILGIPVWITPKVEFFIGLNGSIEAEWNPSIHFTQAIEAGFVYDRDQGWDWIGNGDFDADPDWLDTTLTGKIKLPYLRTSPSIKIYDATGPSLPLETYLKFSAEVDRQWDSDPCDGLLVVSSSWGLSSSFEWEFSGVTKLGKLLHLDQLEKATKFEINAFEWPIKTWYPEMGCSSFPFLQVEGTGILATIPAGTDATLPSTIRLTNTGGVEIPWHVKYVDDNHIAITPDHGNLGPGAATDVLVAVDTAGFNPGVYSNPLTFSNDFDRDQPDSRTGTTEKPVRIEVAPVLSSAPVLEAAAYAGLGRVQLVWSYNTAASPVPIDGYRIDTSFDGGATWGTVLSVGDPSSVQMAQVIGLPAGLVHLRVSAYAGAASSPASNVRSVTVPYTGPPPAETTRLNDTGIDWCADGATNFLTCPVDGYPLQDAQYGRDKTHDDDSDGHAGFSYTKLDANGNPLAASATSWSCVRDNVTGLAWEVKTDDGGLRDKDWTYSWYNPDPTANGGFAGYPDYGDSCFNSARCDTDKYVADVNAQGLCGASDWRLPDPREFMSIVDNSRADTIIDTAWFPRTVSSVFWSSSPSAHYSGYALVVDFSDGNVYDYYKYGGSHVRLVRGGQ